MSTRYFLKELVNSTIRYANGKTIPFTHGAHDMGHLALDTEKDAAQIAELQLFMERRAGGVLEVNEERYEAEKKRQPSSKLSSGVKHAPRLFNQSNDPFNQATDPSDPNQMRQSAQTAAAPANVQAAVGESRAHVVADLAKPDAATFKPRRGKRAA